MLRCDLPSKQPLPKVPWLKKMEGHPAGLWTSLDELWSWNCGSLADKFHHV